MSSDHLAPFSERQGQSAFAWSWLGAAMATTDLSFGVVNAPGQRYNPVIIAQAIATLSQLFDGRLWVAFGSGQYINEHVTGTGWPSKHERNERLLESVRVIRSLLAGETVTCHGRVRASEARLYVEVPSPPLTLGTAISTETAAWVASWADGLITVYQPEGRMEATIEAFRRAGGQGKPVYLQAQHAFAATDEEALAGACDQWRHAVLSSPVLTDLRYPSQIDDASAAARPEDIAKRVRVSANPEQHLAWLREYEALGLDAVYVHNVTRHQSEFIEAFGRHVLPHFLD